MAADVRSLRILEVGDRAVFARAFPANTLWLWTGVRPVAAEPGRRCFGIGEGPRLRRALSSGAYDLVVCHPPRRNPLGARWLLRLLGRYFVLCPPHLLRTCGSLFLRSATGTPLVVLDTEDTAEIAPHNWPLLDRCVLYFKRELPLDRSDVFRKPPGPAEGSWLGKLRPVSLGIHDDAAERAAALSGPKSVDVFFAGALANSPVRAEGAAQLRALSERGVVVDLVEGGLPHAEFLSRCARAWLCWSPEGYGWDCFRHYEAAACGSVPLLSRPTIERYEPLEDGVHALVYDPVGGDLTRVVQGALRDQDRLAAIGEAARAHVLRHHTQRRLCEHIVAATFEQLDRLRTSRTQECRA